MSFIVRPFSLFTDTSVTYDQTKTSLIGKIGTRTLGGVPVVGPPIVTYRNPLTSSEAVTPVEMHMTLNGRVFTATAETAGLVTITLYNLDQNTNELDYVGKITMNIFDTPATTHVIRGFRVLDNGTTGWKIFYLSTGNQLANGGLYMVNDVDEADFQPLPTNFPVATAGGQKATYKLENSPFTNTVGAGISIHEPSNCVLVHNGVSATHQFLVFDYSLPITTVTGGITTDLFVHETGNLPPLSGVLLITNSEDFTVPTTGPNAGEDCVIFHTSTTMYRVRISDLSAAATTMPSLEIANPLPGVNVLTAQTTARAAISNSLQKVILLTTLNVFMVKDFADNTVDFYTQIEGYDNDEATVKEMYPFRVGASTSFDARNGMVGIVSSTTGQRGIYIGNFDCERTYDSTHIISPVIDVAGERLLRFTASFERPDLATPLSVYYRFSGFGSASGGWVLAPDSLSLGGALSPTGQVQFKIAYRVFSNNSTNPIQLTSAGVLVQSLNAISDNWEYSHDDTEATVIPRIAFRLKKAYSTSVPQLFFRAYNLTDTLVTEENTVDDTSSFEYSTDNGVNWLPLGTIPNVVGTHLRYTFSASPGSQIRPSIRES
jgi:hypothetical protein